MRRSFFLTLFLIICLAINTTGQTKKYTKEWLAIEQLEIDGKVTSALEKVNTLHSKVLKSKNQAEQLKTLLFRWKFMQIIDEKSKEKILEEVAFEIKKQISPNKQLLEMYMAHFLEMQLNDNFWNIKNRTHTEGAALEDYRTWDLNTTLEQINFHYQNALNPSLNLVSMPTDNISTLLITLPESRKYKPTIYDVIAHQALSFYTNSRNRVNKPKDEFLINNESYFANSSTFAKGRLQTTDTSSLLFKALQTYQELEKTHVQQKNEEAHIYNTLERLLFVKKNHIGNNTNELYLESLQKLKDEFKNTKHISSIEIELAKAYRNLAYIKDNDGNYKNPDYNKIALELCLNIETDKENSRTSLEAQNLKQQILQQKINWITQNTFLPNKPHLAQISFTNTKSIQVNAYQVPHEFSMDEFNYQYRDSLTKAYLKKRKIHFNKSYKLPVKNDYNNYSTEIIVPKLPLGSYIFSVQTDTLKNSIKYHQVQVTELSINKTDHEKTQLYQVLDRYTGEPKVNASITIKTEIDRNNEEFNTKKLISDEWGNFNVNKKNRYQRTQIIVATTNDTLSVNDNSYGRENNYNYEQENNKYRSKTLLFLDRATYRPQQTVYFKAIAINEESKISNTITGKNIRIEVRNTNREKIHETTLTTNEFGSVHGEFKLPEGGLNGNYSILAILENPKNKKDNYNANQSFSVEEYKRPTFEVAFNPLIKAYKPLDSISITGNAKAFLGSNITDADVTYSVKRTTQYRNWWSRPRGNANSKVITTGEVNSDEKGEFTIKFKAETDEASTTNKIYNYSVEVKVTDVNGETRETSTNIKVADKNLLASVATENTWNTDKNQKIKIKTTDINNNPITTNGTIEVFKLESPGRFLNKRLWSKPDIQQISKNEFIQSFPHTPFTNENIKTNWKKGKRHFEHSFKNTDSTSVEVTNFKNWPSGSYIIITKVTDPITKSTTESQQAIELNKDSQAFPSDEKIFIHTVDYDANKPSKATINLQTSAPKLIVFAEAFDGNISIWKEKFELQKGSKNINLKLPKLKYPKVTIKYHYQLFNYFHSENDVLDYTEKPVILNIEKKHFTDKISPNNSETWSFIINSSDNSNFNAEALASMYDASLDLFKKSNWNSNFDFGKNYPLPSETRALDGLRISSTNFSSNINRIHTSPICFENFYFFGFNFNNPSSWNYKNYLIKLKNGTANISNCGNSTERALMGKLSGVQVNAPSASNRKSKTGTLPQTRMMKAESTMASEAMMDEGEEEIAGIAFVKLDLDKPTIENQTPETELEDLKNIKARTNLQETAFFLPNLRTNKKGEIEFQFTSPEALTRWNFRLLAHTQNGVSGALDAQTITQKELSIITNAPRFVREGDSLRFTVKVANLTTKVLNGTALLEWTDPTNGNTLNSALQHKQTIQNFSIDANGNNLLSWKISIPEGSTAIQYKIVAKAGNFSDGEEKIIPVLSNRKLVTESIPLWVRAGKTENYSLNNFDRNSTTQKPFGITLEYTSNPAWLAIKSLPYLMEFPHTCSEQTFSRLYANTIASHLLNSQPKIKEVFDSWAAKGTLKSPLESNEELKSILIAESPWLQEAKSETDQQQRLGELFNLAKTARANKKALNKLSQLQLPNGGFPWFIGGRANQFITRHILAGFGHLEQLGIANQNIKTDSMVKNTIQFLDKKLITDLEDYLKHHKTAEGFYKQVNLLHYTYARSFFKNRFPLKGEVKDIVIKALTYHKNNWQERSIYEKGLLALSLHRFEKNPIAQKILTGLTESAVQSKENGMYWKENQNSWWWHKNNISTQALLTEAFAEMNKPKKYVEELKIYLLKNKRTNRWESTIQTADATYALLLQGNDWLSVKDNTIINVGGTKIASKKLIATEKEQGTGYLKTHWNADEITPEFKKITVTNKSSVTGYGGYYWQYFEHLDNIKTDDNSPLTIQKELYKKVITDNGTELKKITTSTTLQIGDKVTVRLLVKSDNDMEYLHLKDMRASGFEPTQVLSGYQYKDRLSFYQSTKDVATHFFIDYLPKGNYVLEYDVIANQAGSFSSGITELQSMYAPEFSSHSAGQRVDIIE